MPPWLTTQALRPWLVSSRAKAVMMSCGMPVIWLASATDIFCADARSSCSEVFISTGLPATATGAVTASGAGPMKVAASAGSPSAPST